MPNSNSLNTVSEIITANPGLGFHSLGSDGQFLKISQTELDWLGYEREEVVGKLKFHDLLAEADRERFEKRFPIFQKTGVAKDVEYNWISKSGTIIPISVSGAAICSADGVFKSTVAVVVNLSQRRMAELEVRRQALYQQRLDFISVLDHNLRNPLLESNKLLQMLLSSGTGSESGTRNNAKLHTTEQLNSICELMRTNSYMLERLDAMLNGHNNENNTHAQASKILNQKGVTPDTHAPLWQVIERYVLAAANKESFIQRNLSFNLDLNASSIIVEREAFETLLKHLLDNAVKYSPTDGVISISCIRGNNYFELSVSDQGSGILPQHPEKLFEASAESWHETYFDPNDVIKSGEKLSRCNEIVEEYGGHLTCSNLPNAGAKFTVRIPMFPT
ncbi:MAG TPA: PAS domain-containing sensor histidine kinase [Oculatellaceae cyanobacterium]